MKKYLSLLLVALLLVLCACSNAANQPPAPTETTGEGTGLADNIFNKDGAAGGEDDKSFSASAPISEVTIPEDTTDNPADSTTGATDSTKLEGITGITENDGTLTPSTTTPAGPDTSLTYEEFIAMSGAEQRKYQESFGDISKFFDWYNAAKEAYEKENPPIIIGGGSVTLPTP